MPINYASIKEGDVFMIGNHKGSISFKNLIVTRRADGYGFTGDGFCSSRSSIEELVDCHMGWGYISVIQNGVKTVLKEPAPPPPFKGRVVRD